METDLPEFVLKKLEAPARGADRRSSPLALLARPWELLRVAGLTVDCELEKSGPAGVQSGKQIQARSNTHGHLALERCEM